MHTILNPLSLACTEPSKGSMQVSFLMALAGVSVGGLFIYVGYWRRTRVPHALNGLRAQKRVILLGKHQMYFKYYFEGMSFTN
jgi:hypothetical protein